jgi:hypothetical protein
MHARLHTCTNHVQCILALCTLRPFSLSRLAAGAGVVNGAVAPVQYTPKKATLHKPRQSQVSDVIDRSRHRFSSVVACCVIARPTPNTIAPGLRHRCAPPTAEASMPVTISKQKTSRVYCGFQQTGGRSAGAALAQAGKGIGDPVIDATACKGCSLPPRLCYGLEKSQALL